MTKRRCEDCLYVHIIKTGAGQQYQCRKNPPNLFPVPTQNALGQGQIGFMATWPGTQADDWCGEFRDRSRVEQIEIALTVSINKLAQCENKIEDLKLIVN